MDIKKIIMVIVSFLTLVLLIQNITAFEFDNVKEWNQDSRTITIKNSFGFGDTIATVKGITPHINYVMYGEEVVVAEFEINNVDKVYKDVFKEMEFYNIKGDNKKFDREFKFRYKIQNGTREIPIYETTCSDGLNPKDCGSKIIGYSYIPTYEIKDLEEVRKKDFPKWNVIIQIVTNVKPNERVEFIPTWFGVRMEEFAIWDSGLDTNLIEYYSMENLTKFDRNMTDYFTETYTGNITGGTTQWVTGKVGKAYYTNATMSSQMPAVYGDNSFLDISATRNFTINSWFKANSSDYAQARTIWGTAKASLDVDFKMAVDWTSVGMNVDTLACGGYTGSTWNNQVAQSTTNVTDNQWHMGTCSYNGSHMLIYVDGVLEGWQAVTTINTALSQQSIGTNAQAGEKFTGMIDELGIWNRTLTQSQITQLYNSGDGILYPSSPKITILSPNNNSNSLSPVNFKCSSQDYGSILNLTLIVDGSNNYTIKNTSVNQKSISLNTFISVGLGSHTFNCKSTNSYLKTGIGTQRSFSVKGFTENSQTFNNLVIEGTSQTYSINITYNSSNWNAVTGRIRYNNTFYTGTKIGTGNTLIFTRTLTTPNEVLNTNKTFYWEFIFYGDTSQKQNSTSQTQQVNALSLDDCSVYTILLYNFTLRDEATRNNLSGVGNNTLIEIDLGTNLFNYSNSYIQINPARICSSIALTNSSLDVNLVAGYKADGYVQEFYYIDNEKLNSTQHISLYDLLTTDSTSFLFTYTNENGQSVDNAIVHIYRKYIGDGVFREVERAKEDDNGETHVHLVEEDVIYFFKISVNGVFIYTSSQYNARCISTPCKIDLDASQDSSLFETDWDLIDGGGYSLHYNRLTRDIELDFTIDDVSTMNLTIFEYNSNGVYRSVGSDTLSSIAGTLNVNVPMSSGNKTFFASVFKDDRFIRSHWIDLNEDAGVYFGNTLALFLSFLIILSLSLMAISKGAGVIIFFILGFIITSFMGLLLLTNSTGTSLLMYLIPAGAIILYKIARRNR